MGKEQPREVQRAPGTASKPGHLRGPFRVVRAGDLRTQPWVSVEGHQGAT